MKIFILTIFLLASSVCFSQDAKTYQIRTIGFYNLENLFDPVNDPDKYDEASPIMEMPESLRKEAYQKKLKNMAHVIAEIGHQQTNNAPVLLGIAEVENRRVIEDLINQPILLSYHYGIIHYDSPDIRGIDVALLYQKKAFRPIVSSSHRLLIYEAENPKKRVYTRDQLLVKGSLDGDILYLIINHWPSRRGGEAKSRYKRESAAALNKRLIDSIQVKEPYAKIITMGDLNDGPTNSSLKNVLKTKASKKNLKRKDLYNPMENMQRKQGMGTIAYRDSWDLFDQMIMTSVLLKKNYSSYRFYKAGIFNPRYLKTATGKYKGYPFRSFNNSGFPGGYSDHFPVYIFLVRAVK